MVEYKDGEITGKIITWYRNGKIESEKQMSSNMKQGKLFVWYEDGNLMMIEDYESDNLIQGKYLKKGDEVPVSRVINGCGTVTLFDSKGNFIKKFEVEKGVPSES
jgi:antitoxin component YwqK of YwqJK toxin-antitoxin module